MIPFMRPSSSPAVAPAAVRECLVDGLIGDVVGLARREGRHSVRSAVESPAHELHHSPPEATLGKGPASPGIVLRLEGDPRTTFSGICTVGGKENVLSGRVPKRYAFEGQKLSCRIQKQDSGRGSLKVILTANDTTRSVQQTNTRGGIMHISYEGN